MKTFQNIVLSLVYFVIVSFIGYIFVSSYYIYSAFPFTVYMFWLLYVSLGFTFNCPARVKDGIFSVIAPLFINLALFLYGWKLSNSVPNLQNPESFDYWAPFYETNAVIVASPVFLKKSMLYVRYFAVILLPSVLMYVGMLLGCTAKRRLKESVNNINIGKK